MTKGKTLVVAIIAAGLLVVAYLLDKNLLPSANANLCAAYTNQIESQGSAIELCRSTPNCILSLNDIQLYNSKDNLRKFHCEAAAREEAS